MNQQKQWTLQTADFSIFETLISEGNLDDGLIESWMYCDMHFQVCSMTYTAWVCIEKFKLIIIK